VEKSRSLLLTAVLLFVVAVAATPWEVEKSRSLLLTAVLLFVVAVAATPWVLAEKGGDDLTGPYNLVAGWPQNPCGEGYTFGSTAGIFADSPNRVLIFQRGCLPVLPDGGSDFGPGSLEPGFTQSGAHLPAGLLAGSPGRR